MANAKVRCYKFRYDKNGVEFCCLEGSKVYARVTTDDRGENTCLGECDPITGELLKAKTAKATDK